MCERSTSFTLLAGRFLSCTGSGLQRDQGGAALVHAVASVSAGQDACSGDRGACRTAVSDFLLCRDSTRRPPLITHRAHLACVSVDCPIRGHPCRSLRLLCKLISPALATFRMESRSTNLSTECSLALPPAPRRSRTSSARSCTVPPARNAERCSIKSIRRPNECASSCE